MGTRSRGWYLAPIETCKQRKCNGLLYAAPITLGRGRRVQLAPREKSTSGADRPTFHFQPSSTRPSSTAPSSFPSPKTRKLVYGNKAAKPAHSFVPGVQAVPSPEPVVPGPGVALVPAPFGVLLAFLFLFFLLLSVLLLFLLVGHLRRVWACIPSDP